MVFNALGRLFGYLIFYKSNLENLNNEFNQLEETRDTVQLSVDAAQRNGEVIRPDVKGWLERVYRRSIEAKSILEDEAEANKRCLNGWCPNLQSRYSLSRKARMKAQEVSELQGRGNFTTVSYTAPPPGIESINTEGTMDFESRRLIMNDVMEALKDDRFNMIRICGMGGVGKTTMVTKVAKEAKEENLFDEVVMVVMSQSPDERKIQGEIADKLGLKFVGESLSGRADRLRERLGSIKRILVILDDVWKRLKLNDIGIPFGEGHRGCKILLTSRSNDVCNDMGAQKKFTVPVLATNEAWNLFKEMAGISNDTTDMHSTQMAVANECGCLPIAIVTVGRALNDRGKLSWDYALQQLQKSIVKNITIVEKEVFKSLELSYNFLESEEAKKFFLLCSLFPKDSSIQIEHLVRYVIGLELSEDIDTMDEARVKVYFFVDYLKRCHLLMDNEDKEFVKMHGVIRMVAISIASREEYSFFVRCDDPLKYWVEKDQHKNYAVISLRVRGVHRLSNYLEFRKLHFLQLAFMDNDILLETPGSLFYGMEELKVIALSKMLIQPVSLLRLTNLRTLLLINSQLIDNDISLIGELRHLEILSFAGSRGINELPGEIGNLIHLKLLDLMNCYVERIYPGVLSSLSKLEELYVGDSFINWEVVEEGKERTNASIAELKSLSNLVALDIQIIDSKLLEALWPRDLGPV